MFVKMCLSDVSGSFNKSMLTFPLLVLKSFCYFIDYIAKAFALWLKWYPKTNCHEFSRYTDKLINKCNLFVFRITFMRRQII